MNKLTRITALPALAAMLASPALLAQQTQPSVEAQHSQEARQEQQAGQGQQAAQAQQSHQQAQQQTQGVTGQKTPAAARNAQISAGAEAMSSQSTEAGAQSTQSGTQSTQSGAQSSQQGQQPDGRQTQPAAADPAEATQPIETLDLQSVALDDALKDKFVAAYTDILEIQSRYTQRLEQVTDQTQARALQQEAQQEMQNALVENDLTPEEYNHVIQLASESEPLMRDLEQKIGEEQAR